MGPKLSVWSSVLGEIGKKSSKQEIIQSVCDDYWVVINAETQELWEDQGKIGYWRNEFETIGLYAARFFEEQNPFWADQEISIAFDHKLPPIKTLQNAHALAMEVRLAQKARKAAQQGRRFKRAQLQDLTNFRMAAQIHAGSTIDRASKEAARWADDFSDGET